MRSARIRADEKIQSQFIAGIDDMLGAFFPIPRFNIGTDSISSRRRINKILPVVKPARHYTLREAKAIKIREILRPKNKPTKNT